MTTESETLRTLLEKFGLLLRVEDAADVFRTSPAALRASVARGHGFGAALRTAVVRRGRRIFFRSADVAKILDGEAQP